MGGILFVIDVIIYLDYCQGFFMNRISGMI